jgi:polyphosphate kinase 2 (PPK2 family)
LVERVEGLCSEYDWMRGYHEINEFEEQMAESGTIVLKFWLSITAEEQLKRFRERENVAYKRHKITPEDWRNRKKWPKYERAVCDMIERTSTAQAPWHVVPANDKRFARVTVLQTLADALEAQL